MPLKITDLNKCASEVFLYLRENKTLAYTQKELAELLNINQSSISRQLKKLKNDKLIESVQNWSEKGAPYYFYYGYPEHQ